MDPVLLDESLFDALRHPRGRAGKWVDAFGEHAEQAAPVARLAAKIEPPPITRRSTPVHQTSAFRMAKRRPAFATESGPHGDELMYELAHDRGFAGSPHLASEDVLQAGIEEGDKELWRGMSDESYAQALMRGPAFYGQGFRGNGIYAASGGRAQAMAKAYATAPPTRGVTAKTDAPVVVHMALHRHAKTISFESALTEAKAAQGSAQDEVLQQMYRDPGRWAMAQGYDAVIVQQPDGSDETIVLNRTALIISTVLAPAGRNVAAAPRAAAA